MIWKAQPLPSGRLPPSLARGLERTSAILVAAAALVAVVAGTVDARRFAFSYLVGFVWATTIAIGGLILVLLQHLTHAGWSASARRQMEWLAGALPLLALAFAPLALLSPHVYEWMSPAALADPMLAKKHAYLNAPAWLVRAAVYFAVWSSLAWSFARTSRAQDTSAHPEIETAKLQRRSAPSVIAVGLTLSFAAFDWLMSLDPRWYSTIFGVYVIAGSLVAGLATLALSSIALERRGVLGPVSTVEHRHDIGKLLFGFTVFWAYIAFCQYFLIWYAGLPEETIFFRHRWVGSWQTVSLLLVAGHFVVPFVLLLSRHGKRNLTVLATAATLLLAMHYVDMYWLVMPTLDPRGAHPSWIDLAGLAPPASLVLWWLARRAAREPAYCVRDPRLPEAIRLENL
jgi:hypothetical protein